MVGGLCAVLGARDLPAHLFRPDLAPEQMIQLLSALFACCVLLAVRSDAAPLERLAAVDLVTRRATWTAWVLAIGSAITAVVWWLLPADIAGSHVRNVAAYVGIGLLVQTSSLVVALAVPWVWFAVSSVVGQESVRGLAVADWWAYPVQPADWHPEAAVLLLAAGITVRVLRG